MGLHITPLYSWLVTANEIKQSISVITLKVPSHITLFSKNYVNIAVRNGYIADFNYSCYPFHYFDILWVNLSYKMFAFLNTEHIDYVVDEILYFL